MDIQYTRAKTLRKICCSDYTKCKNHLLMMKFSFGTESKIGKEVAMRPCVTHVNGVVLSDIAIEQSAR